MLKSMLKSAVAGVIACMVATIAASFLYLLIVVGQALDRRSAFSAIFFGVGVSIRGLWLAVPVCVLLSFTSKRIPRILFVAVSMLAGAILGVVLSYWSFNPLYNYQVAREYAAVLLGLTWASAAVVLATSGSRSPD
jgi:hypothetical protein